MNFYDRPFPVPLSGDEGRPSVAPHGSSPPGLRIILKSQVPLCLTTLYIGQILGQDFKTAHARCWFTFTVTQRELIAEECSPCSRQLAEVVITLRRHDHFGFEVHSLVVAVADTMKQASNVTRSMSLVANRH